MHPSVADITLPDAVQADLEAMQHESSLDGLNDAARAAAIQTIEEVIKKKREEALAHRKNSGIEDLWTYCDEAYLGIDDANRSDAMRTRWVKPTSMTGPVQTANEAQTRDDTRSILYIPLTSRYVDAGAAKLSEILLPPDDKAFSFEPTPIPELVKGSKDLSQIIDQIAPGLHARLTRAATAGELRQMGHPAALPQPVSPSFLGPTPPPPGGPPSPPLTNASAAVPAVPGPATAGGLPPPAAVAGSTPGTPGAPQVPLTTQDLAREAMAIATEKAKAAEQRIYDWMVEGHYRRECRKVIFDQARLGTGVLKGPYPMSSSSRAVVRTTSPDGHPAIALEMEDQITPGFKWVDAWNFFPDPSCGESVRDGDYCFERDYLSPRRLRALAKQPGYRQDAIGAVLAEGPKMVYSGGRDRVEQTQERQYEVWYYYGALTRVDLTMLNPDAERLLAARRTRQKTRRPSPPDDSGQTNDTVPPEMDMVYAIVTIVNDRVIYATLQPIDSGELPFHVCTWRRRAGYWAGIGVAEQVASAQRMINGASRAMMNNGGNSAGSQIVVNKNVIEPQNEEWKLTPDKVWVTNDDGGSVDIDKAFRIFEIPTRTQPLMLIVEYALKLAEESSSIPLVTQGQSGTTTPDTYGATQLQNNNANQLLRDIGYGFDEAITDPVVRQCYEWLLLDPDVPEEEKGDFQINAHGSISLVEHAIEAQTIQQMSGLVLNPAFRIDPDKWVQLLLKSRHVDPRDVQYSDVQKEALEKQPPTPPPQVLVAQINAQVKEAVAKMQAQIDQLKIQRDANEAQQVQAIRLQELQLQERLAILQYATQQKVDLEKVKAGLADTALRLKTEKELAAADLAVEVHKHHHPGAEAATWPAPPVEPPAQVPGKAPNRHAAAQV